VYLHEAIECVIRQNRNTWMSPDEITDAVNDGKLFRRKRDGGPVRRNQVSARLSNHRHTFEQNDQGEWRIRPDKA